MTRLALWPLVAGCLSACGAPSSVFGVSGYPSVGNFSLQQGAAIIQEGEFKAEADQIPWSGYWYPLSRIDAREALKKYDRLSGRHALQVEEERIQRETHPLLPWEGRCDAWAFASILHPEPRSPVEVSQEGSHELFSIADQKALWIFAHERVEAYSRMTVGTRNDGDGTSPFEDLLPAEFHRVLQVMLLEKRQPFIMDRDPRPPVWNTPVYGARWKISRDLFRKDVFHVQAWIHAIFPYDENLDSVDRIAPVLEYSYDLEAHPVAGGFEVHGSRWIGGSVRDHPDFVTIIDPKFSGSASSMNPEIDVDWLRSHLMPSP